MPAVGTLALRVKWNAKCNSQTAQNLNTLLQHQEVSVQVSTTATVEDWYCVIIY